VVRAGPPEDVARGREQRGFADGNVTDAVSEQASGDLVPKNKSWESTVLSAEPIEAPQRW